MTNDDFGTTRRSVLKLAGSAAIGAAGFSSAATAAGVEWDEDDVVRDDDGKSEWIVRIDRQASEDTKVTVDTAKETAWESQQEIKKTLRVRQGYSVEKQFWLANAMLVKAQKDAMAAKKELSALSTVRTVHPNFEFEGPEPVEKQELVPEKAHEYTYGLNQINAPDVWDHFDTKGEGTSVAVLDTGVDADHPDIDLPEGNWAEFDEEGNQVDSEPHDPGGHGTHTSGTVSGGDASGYHIGVAPETELYHGKVLDDGGTWAQIIAGMEWASAEEGVDAINMSLGGTGYFDVLIEPVRNVESAGTILVTSAGNSEEGSSGSPGNVYESFSIGASDIERNIAGFSSGELINTSEDWTASWLTEDWPLNYYVPDVSAPGVNVYSSVPGGEYALYDGTSMASPHVVGAVALLLSSEPDLDIPDIKEAFETTAKHGEGPDALPGPRYGKGIIDVLSAVTAANDGNIIEGTVTYNGEPFEEAVVKTDYGTQAQTDEEGKFSLYVDDGEWALSVDEFGFVSEEVTVDVSDGETVVQDIELIDELDAELVSNQPDVIGQGESFQIEGFVANLESLTVSLLSGSDVSAEDLTVKLMDSTILLGESFDLSEAVDGKISLTVGVNDDAPLDNFALEHEFVGEGETITKQTGPTKVMEDPADASLEILDWDETQEVANGGTLQVWAEVENTGDRTGRGISHLIEYPDPTGFLSFAGNNDPIPGGETKEVSFDLALPAWWRQPGSEWAHGWQTATDDFVSTKFEILGPVFEVKNIEAPAQVDHGDTMDITATLENVGNLKGEEMVDYNFAGNYLRSKYVTANVGQTAQVSFEFDPEEVVRDQYQFSIVAWNSWYELGHDNTWVTENVWIGPAQLPEIDLTGDGNHATDTTGDFLLNDINGDGEFDGDDVRAFYKHYKDDVVQQNPEYFNFDKEDPPEVDIEDVRALYKMQSSN